MRQRFALTRLRNFFRDVRTTNNNTTWPPERDASPTNRGSGGGAPHGVPGHHHHHLGPHGPGTDGGDGDSVHVAFFDSERAIKTPRPVVGCTCCAGVNADRCAAHEPVHSSAAPRPFRVRLG